MYKEYVSTTHLSTSIALRIPFRYLALIITPYGVFCYQVMPFGLKNAGATYQCMMQNCLASQIGRNIQVYIDDMVITTRKEESLISDL
jgi:hypothetical protein